MFVVEETLESGEVIGFAVSTDVSIEEYPEFVTSTWRMAELGLAEKLKVEYDGAATIGALEDTALDVRWDELGPNGRELPVRHDGSNTLVRRVPGENDPNGNAGRVPLDDQGAATAGPEDATP